MKNNFISFTLNNSQHFTSVNLPYEEAFGPIELIHRHACYAPSAQVKEKIEGLLDFFEKELVGTQPFKVVLSNNTVLVMFNIVTDLLMMMTVRCRMTHAEILEQRKACGKDKEKVRGIRVPDTSVVMYSDISVLSRLLDLLSKAVYNNTSITVAEYEVKE